MTNYSGPRRFSSPPTAQELERLVADLAELYDSFNLGPQPRFAVPLGIARSDVTLQFGKSQRVDTGKGQSVRALLPEPDARYTGRTVCLVRSSALGSIRVVSPRRETLIDGRSSVTLPAFVGAYLFLFDGKHWREVNIPLTPSEDPNQDALMTVDGAIMWSSRAPRVLDTTYAPVALYQFSNGAPNGLLDVSGVANAHLTVSAGTERYAWMHPQMQGLLLDGASEMIHNAANATVALTGDMSVIWTGTILAFPGATQPTLVAHGAAGELAAANILYSLFQNNAATTDGRLLTYQHERGAGVDEIYAFGTAWTFPNVITQFGFRRTANVIQGFNQGYPWAAASAALGAPTDGGSGRLRVGGFNGASFFTGIVSSLAIYNRALTNAEFLERYNYTLGPAFGRKG